MPESGALLRFRPCPAASDQEQGAQLGLKHAASEYTMVALRKTCRILSRRKKKRVAEPCETEVRRSAGKLNQQMDGAPSRKVQFRVLRCRPDRNTLATSARSKKMIYSAGAMQRCKPLPRIKALSEGAVLAPSRRDPEVGSPLLAAAARTAAAKRCLQARQTCLVPVSVPVPPRERSLLLRRKKRSPIVSVLIPSGV